MVYMRSVITSVKENNLAYPLVVAVDFTAFSPGPPGTKPGSLTAQHLSM